MNALFMQEWEASTVWANQTQTSKNFLLSSTKLLLPFISLMPCFGNEVIYFDDDYVMIIYYDGIDCNVHAHDE